MLRARNALIRPDRARAGAARGAAGAVAVAAALAVTAGVAGCAQQVSARPVSFGEPHAGPATPAGRVTYRVRAGDAARILETTFYNGTGLWHMCLGWQCNTKNRDWGSDSLTYTLYLRWELFHDRSVLPLLRTLAQTAPAYQAGQRASSDTAAWDAIADMREYEATGSRAALSKAQMAVRWLVRSAGFAAGKCPRIDYQWAGGGPDRLKTLETGSNLAKAALLLYRATRKASYLKLAESQYAAARRYFLARSVPVYTSYVFDSGSACRAVPRQYLASVNGNMIWVGETLAGLTGQRRYLRQAIATARAVSRHLGDGTGVFTDLLADTDIVEPLVEAMDGLAAARHQAFARRWLLTAASAAGSDLAPDGGYGRFFGGPPPAGPVTAWQANGGLALMQAAAALDPRGAPAAPGFWNRGVLVSDNQRLAARPVRITFTGRAIAITGTLGDVCCQAGHARVVIDGHPTFSGVGIWQDKSSAARRLPGELLLAWRWRTAGRHTIEILPGLFNPFQGGPSFHMTGYYLVR